ncbi:TetR/AcrR family transcriptional regulator [Nannocystaceae bacterium ST9]
MEGPSPGSKRDRTRSALLVAAQELLLERSAGSLSIRDVTARAGVVHGTFYNYFASIEALLDGVGLLFFAEHARIVDALIEGIDDPAEVFALTTRQTLRFVTASPDYGRLAFDAGLPVDRFLLGLRVRLRRDVVRGVERGSFELDEVELAVGMITGSLLGVALDIHRGVLPAAAIEQATARLLRTLGVPNDRARSIAERAHEFAEPPALPLRGLVSPPIARKR